MCLIDPEERAEITAYLNRSRVIYRVATETPAGELTRAQRVHEAYLTVWRLLTTGLQGEHRARWRALVGGARRDLDRAVAPVIRARLLGVSRRAA